MLVGVAVFALLVGTGVLAGGEIPFGSAAADRGDQPGRAAEPRQPPVRPATPTRLLVPSVGIDATVRPVRLDADLALRPPRQPELVGWWDESAEPGVGAGAQPGGTVIAGHTVHDPAVEAADETATGVAPNRAAGAAGTVDVRRTAADDAREQDGPNRKPGGGAMDRLPEVAEGARVLVRTENGVVRYRVGKVVHYSKAELAEHAERIFDQQRSHRLVLVTCEDWNGTEYLSNVVIFAQPLPAAA